MNVTRIFLAIGLVALSLSAQAQYFDVETGLHYNGARYYDPRIGRYISSDPIGLAGGLNTYRYGENNPFRYTDPDGLKTYKCTKPLDALGGSGKRSGPDIWGNPAYHQYSCVVDKDGKVTCGGQDRAGDGLSLPFSPYQGSPGKLSNDHLDPERCEQSQPDNNCFEKCLIDEWAKPRPRYGIPYGTDCQEYDDDVNQKCAKQCKVKK